jgi:hypothetical protein
VPADSLDPGTHEERLHRVLHSNLQGVGAWQVPDHNETNGYGLSQRQVKRRQAGSDWLVVRCLDFPRRSEERGSPEGYRVTVRGANEIYFTSQM